MKLMLENAILDIRPGVRVIASASGVLVVEPDVTVEPVHKGSGNGVAEPVKAKRPATATALASLPRGFIENEILQALHKQPDPYAWRGFGEILAIAFSTIPRNKGGSVSKDYHLVNSVMKVLRDNGELEYQRGPDGLRGRQARGRYRLPKPADAPTPLTGKEGHAAAH